MNDNKEKQKSSMSGLQKALIIIGVLLIGGSLVYSGYQWVIAHNHAEQINELKTYVRTQEPETGEGEAQEETYVSPYKEIFDMNSNMVAWLKIPDAKVDYPVM